MFRILYRIGRLQQSVLRSRYEDAVEFSKTVNDPLIQPATDPIPSDRKNNRKGKKFKETDKCSCGKNKLTSDSHCNVCDGKLYEKAS